MNILRREQVCADVADRWRDTHFKDTGWDTSFGEMRRECIHEALQGLCAATPSSRAAIDAAIGNESWTPIRCDECSQDAEVAVEVGEPPDYESSTVVLCVPCLTRALDLAHLATALEETHETSESDPR